MVDDTLTRDQLFVHDDVAEDCRQGLLNLVRIRIAQTGCERTLGIYIHQQNALTHPGQANAEIHRSDCFTNAALLVADCYCYCHFRPPCTLKNTEEPNQ